MQNFRALFQPKKCHFALIKKFSSQSEETIVKDEIKKFNEWANHWWDPNGPVHALHHLNGLRIPFITKCVLNNPSQSCSGTKSEAKDSSLPLKGYKLIDIGCGAGLLSEPLARIGADTTGLDAAADLITVAKHHASLDPTLSQNLRYVNTTVDDHAKQNSASYDVVTCSEVIEHVDNQEFFVQQCAKLVKPGGSLIFTTINRTFMGWFVFIFLMERVFSVIPKGTHQYNMLIHSKDLQKMLQSNNCDVRQTQGIVVLPSGKWLAVPTLAFNYVMHAVKTTA